jgi:hypothetical protein
MAAILKIENAQKRENSTFLLDPDALILLYLRNCSDVTSARFLFIDRYI